MIAADTAAPVAKKRPTVRELHGDKFVDDYFWLREKGNPEVTAYLEAENAYTDVGDGAATRRCRTRSTRRCSAASRRPTSRCRCATARYFYYTRTEQGQQYPIYCRKKGSLDAPEEVYLDVNALAKGEKFMAIGALSVSDDGNLLAYTHRHHRLPRIQALRARPAHRRAARAAGREGDVGRLGRGQQDAVLHDHRRGQAAVPPLSPRASAPAAAARCSTRRRTSASASASADRAARPTCSSRSAA